MKPETLLRRVRKAFNPITYLTHSLVCDICRTKNLKCHVLVIYSHSACDVRFIFEKQGFARTYTTINHKISRISSRDRYLTDLHVALHRIATDIPKYIWDELGGLPTPHKYGAYLDKKRNIVGCHQSDGSLGVLITTPPGQEKHIEVPITSQQYRRLCGGLRKRHYALNLKNQIIETGARYK